MTKRSPGIREAFEFLTVAIVTLSFLFTVAGIGASLLGHNSAGTRDFVEYWAAGQQLVHHANPYDGVAIRKWEISAGFPPAAPTLYLGNPPSALLLVLPLGFVSPTVGEFLWEILLLLSLVLSVHIIRQSLSDSSNRLHWIVYAFAPMLTCLLGGQIAILLLLGLALFLRLYRSFPFLAGASLWFCMLKPHLFLPFGVVLIAWVVMTHRYRIFAGAAVSLTFSSAIATLLNPGIWTSYRIMMREQRIDLLDLPSISVYWRKLVYPHTFWVQCLPALIGCAWALGYFRRHRAHWSWLEQGSVVMLVSVLVAPYSWFMDQTILIPSLLYGLYRSRSRTLIAILALISATLEIAALRGVGLYSSLYVFTVPLWLAWFVLATKNRAFAKTS